MVSEKGRAPVRWSPGSRLLKIGELMHATGIGRQTIHNYTVLGLLREEARTQGGHRLYPENTVRALLRIVELKKRMPLAEIRRVLQQTPAKEE